MNGEMNPAPGEFASHAPDPAGIQCFVLVYIILVPVCFLVLLYLLFCWSRLREDHKVEEIQIEDPELGTLRIIMISNEGRSLQQRIGMVVLSRATGTQGLPDAEERRGGGRNTVCPICLEDFKGGDECRSVPRCRHVYHRACLAGWLQQKRHCPVCRSRV
ncbi:hypothetical protein MLD38_026549 [Melastoma candidum]|uniref:Uncharacterized protein n=1 Tax=Melastoma candidum TaxID=119954 RepID=A0ACB9NYY8_9MYRT|nr:hypothetical protein MLD38_026549 [Melastoma candidum]